MKILFICRSNAERSQIAEILFNYHSKRHRAMSAGVNVEKENSAGLGAGRIVSELLLSNGHGGITKVKRKQLTEDMARRAEKSRAME